MSSASKKLIWLSLLFIFVNACATSPRGRKQLILVPDDQMEAMGIQAFAEMKVQKPVNTDARVNSYVRCVADAVTSAVDGGAGRKWEVLVFADDSANAFALPGGKIGVFTGLLKIAQTPSQLATVIGHEVGHVIARHGNERVSEAVAAQGGLEVISAAMKEKGPQHDLIMAALGLGAQFGVLLPHSRVQETEADVIGLDLMAKAGFDPRESVNLWQNMEKSSGGQPPEFLSTHPSHGARIEKLRQNMSHAIKLYQAAPSHSACQH
jgi:predicted Zn-dependent protease